MGARPPLPDLSDADHLLIRPWPDPVLDERGHDPRSAYVEQFWLGILGPSTVWLLRRMAAGLEQSPAGFALPFDDTARALGLGGRGRSSPFVRSLARCCQFGMAEPRTDPDADGAVLAVRRRLPPLSRRQLEHLPPSLQQAHAEWQEGDLRTPALERLRRRSRRLALALVELGEDLEGTERQLQRWRFHPAVCRESALWAWKRHAEAHAAAAQAGLDAPIPRPRTDDAGRPVPAA